MKDINITRKNIDNIDKELAKLFQERMNLVKDVLEYKVSNSLPILDSSREKEVIEKNLSLVDKEYQEYYRNFVEKMLEISKEFQNNLIKK